MKQAGERPRRPRPVPAGFEIVRDDAGALVLARADVAEYLAARAGDDPEEEVRDGGNEPDHLEGGRERRLPVGGAGARGRGPTARWITPSGRSLILKKYRRGGALAPILPDLFVRCRRMLWDLETWEAARSRSVPVAAAAGLILKRRLGVLWSAYLLTEEIAGAVTLTEALSAAPSGARSSRLAEAALAAVRRLHDAGIWHRDLNMGNLLVREVAPAPDGDPGAVEVFVIDLEGGRVFRALTPALRFSNLSRLDRSYVKRFGSRGPLGHEDRLRLLARYCRNDEGLRREMTSRLEAHARSLRRHARLWRRHPGESRARGPGEPPPGC